MLENAIEPERIDAYLKDVDERLPNDKDFDIHPVMPIKQLEPELVAELRQDENPVHRRFNDLHDYSIAAREPSLDRSIVEMMTCCATAPFSDPDTAASGSRVAADHGTARPAGRRRVDADASGPARTALARPHCTGLATERSRRTLPGRSRAGKLALMTGSEPHRVTALVRRLGNGDAAVAEELLPLVYEELRRVAGAMFARQHEGHTLQPTALVHEAWLKLAGTEQPWESRSHFFSVAARAMRQVLVDSARARRAERRGGEKARVTFDDQVGASKQGYDLIDFDDALQRLAAANPRYAQVVELRLLGGLTVDEVANLLGLTPRTIKLDWRAARAWLRHELEGPMSA